MIIIAENLGAFFITYWGVNFGWSHLAKIETFMK